MTTLEAMVGARQVLAEMGWCRGVPAMDEEGEWRRATSPKAVVFCALGAVDRVTDHNPFLQNDVNRLLSDLSGHPILTWNDAPGRTKEEVIALFDQAIASLEEE